MHKIYSDNMPWGNGWRFRNSQYPGNGPFAHLPPYERPGWRYFGRGVNCYWYNQLTPEEKRKYLEEEKKYLTERLKEIEEEEKKI